MAIYLGDDGIARPVVGSLEEPLPSLAYAAVVRLASEEQRLRWALSDLIALIEARGLTRLVDDCEAFHRARGLSWGS